jgi:hypothetical protein
MEREAEHILYAMGAEKTWCGPRFRGVCSSHDLGGCRIGDRPIDYHLEVLRNFGALASTVESSVRTDIPRDQLPDLIRLVGRLDPKRTLTVTFGRRYIARRRAHDRFPIANVGAMRTTAREAILQLRPDTERDVETARRAC